MDHHISCFGPSRGVIWEEGDDLISGFLQPERRTNKWRVIRSAQWVDGWMDALQQMQSGRRIVNGLK